MSENTPLQIFNCVVAQKNDLVPDLYRAQIVNEFLQPAGEQSGIKFELRFGIPLEYFLTPEFRFTVEAITVAVMGLARNDMDLQHLSNYLESHPATQYGIFTMRDYEKKIKKAGFEHVIAFSEKSDAKIDFARQLLTRTADTRVK